MWVQPAFPCRDVVDGQSYRRYRGINTNEKAGVDERGPCVCNLLLVPTQANSDGM